MRLDRIPRPLPAVLAAVLCSAVVAAPALAEQPARPPARPEAAPGAQVAPAKPKRFPQLTLEQLTPEQRPLGEEILKISSVGLAGPYNPMMRSPVMAERLFRLLEYLRFKTSVPRRLNEFAILIQARLWTSQVEWYAHHPLALKAGLPESVAADLKAGKRPAAMKPDEAAVYDLCMELSTQHAISDATFQRAKELLGEQQVVDLIAVSGTYVTVAMLLNGAEEGVPAGKKPPLEPLPDR
ncbi:MAG: carboxymuconolactone decarboxylase [Myxococcales bacterium]